jgi:predicted nucleic acid-binding Zn ribbon protein
MDSLSGLLNKKKSSSPVMRGAVAALTVEEADRILAGLFGAEVAHFAKCAYVRNGVLAIRTTGSASATEIKMNETAIISKITQKFGPDSVKIIRYIA